MATGEFGEDLCFRLDKFGVRRSPRDSSQSYPPPALQSAVTHLRITIPSSELYKLEFRLSALMDSDLAWVNGKGSGPV